MTRARVEQVPSDLAVARALLEQARAHLASAALAGMDPGGALTLAYQAALKAMIAGLLAHGRRVTSGAGGHAVIIREARALTGDGELFDRIDRMRRDRHRTTYDLDEVTDAERADALRDATTAVEAMAAAVREVS